MPICRKLFGYLSILIIILATTNAFTIDYCPEDDNANMQLTNPTADAQPVEHLYNGNIVRIAVLGPKGSGVSTTIHQLIGPNSDCGTPIHSTTDTLQHFQEYTLDIPSTDKTYYQLKLVDIPSFDGNLEQDSQILASLKSYIQVSGQPDFFLGISKFDDNKINKKVDSPFVQFLEKFELFHTVLSNNISIPSGSVTVTSGFLFLFTHSMAETRAVQRRPQGKINEFKRVIRQHTTFSPSQISIVIGDNKADEYGAMMENGYYKLANRQLYPKNVWESLVNFTSAATTTTTTKEILLSIMNSRQVSLQCQAKLIPTKWKYYDDDVAAFSYLFTGTNKTVRETAVNRKVEEVFQNNTQQVQMEDIVQKIALQVCLQQENIVSIEDVPKNNSDRAALFQKHRQFSAPIPAKILKEAFQFEMPIYSRALTVGYGYLVINDEISLHTPFRTDIVKLSPIGYQFPNFMKCGKLDNVEIKSFQSYSANMSDYIHERFKYLDFIGKENVDCSPARVKDGFNRQPELNETGDDMTLTVVQEYRTLTCTLISDSNEWSLNSEFIEQVNALRKLDGHDKDCVSQWENWFKKWGSHIIVQSYGGGSLHGSFVQKLNSTNVLESRLTIEKTLDSIVKFTARFPVKNLVTPSYRLYGGENDENRTIQLFALKKYERINLIEKWKKSLGHDFIMLTNEFRLQPISILIGIKFGEEKGRLVHHAMDLFIRGKLKYSERKNSTLNVQAGNQDDVSVDNNGTRENNSSDATPQTNSSNAVIIAPRILCIPNPLKRLKQESKREEHLMQQHLDAIQRQNEEDEANHQLMMAELQGKNKPVELIPANPCSRENTLFASRIICAVHLAAQLVRNSTVAS